MSASSTTNSKIAKVLLDPAAGDLTICREKGL
jgi:hypothetical protein